MRGTDKVVEANGAGTDLIKSSVTFALAANVENLTLTGGAAIKATGNGLANHITGNSGDNILNGGGGDDTMAGGAGNDTANGGQGNDTYDIALGGGIHRIFDAGGSADRLAVASFSDIASSVRVGDNIVVSLTDGSKIIVVKHFLAANQVENVIDADGHVVVLATGTIGGNASGIISGTDGGDSLNGNGGDDILFGNGGNDLLIGGTGRDALHGGDGADTLRGGSGSDTLLGNLGDDALFGGPGQDKLVGGGGNDTLVGGSGYDWMKGAAGDDTFKFDDILQAPVAGPHDHIADFAQGHDRMDLSGIDAKTGGEDDAFAFIGNQAFSGGGAAGHCIS